MATAVSPSTSLSGWWQGVIVILSQWDNITSREIHDGDIEEEIREAFRWRYWLKLWMTETIRLFEILCLSKAWSSMCPFHSLIILIIQAIAKSQLYVNESLSLDFIIIRARAQYLHSEWSLVILLQWFKWRAEHQPGICSQVWRILTTQQCVALQGVWQRGSRLHNCPRPTGSSTKTRGKIVNWGMWGEVHICLVYPRGSYILFSGTYRWRNGGQTNSVLLFFQTRIVPSPASM